MAGPDEITVTNTAPKYAPHPEGTFGATCVDVIDLGERVEQFQGNPAKVVHKCALVFDAGETNPDTGEAHLLHPEFTVSAHERASLRQFLEGWRGRTYKDAELEAGLPLHKLVGHTALLTVEHKVSGAGRAYAKIRSVSPMPKGMAAPTTQGYERADWWAERKAEYAAEVAKHRGGPAKAAFGDDIPETLAQPEDGEDGLPW